MYKCRHVTCWQVLELARQGHVGLRCEDEHALKQFVTELLKRKADYERFDQYDQSSTLLLSWKVSQFSLGQGVQSYFQYYAKLSNQQNMLQDGVRTSTYNRAIVENAEDFVGKTAMDLGAGSGILSFFAVQAGAEKVYAVEASSMADVVRLLADANSFLTKKIEVINRPVESITSTELPSKAF